MGKLLIGVLTIVCTALTVGCTVPKPQAMTGKDAAAIEAVGNKQIAFEKVDPAELDQGIYKENTFLSYIVGYNYWKTPEGYIFIISTGPKGTPGHGINITSVEEDKEGRTVIVVGQSSPPQGEVQVQLVTFPTAIYRIEAENENFVVKTQSGMELPHYSKNEFAVTGTVTDIITLKGYLYPPHYLRVIPDIADNRLNGIYFDDFVQFNVSNAASGQAGAIKKGDKVSLIYDIGGMDDYNIKSVTRLDKAAISADEAEKAVEYLCGKPDIGVNVFHNSQYDIEANGVR